MALELFKPFVMRQLVEKGFAHNIKSAKRIVERVNPAVWDVLEEVIKDHPVLLNRAPTLHRLGIQAFMPVLVEGSAIQIHPLVCTAFNADFDGDQMAVHVPLSTAAQEEARTMLLSTSNLLSPADGSPIVTPTQDMVLGCYYLTTDVPERDRDNNLPAPRPFADEEAALLAYELSSGGMAGGSSRTSGPFAEGDARSDMVYAPVALRLHEPIEVSVKTWDDEAGALVDRRIVTTVGRIIFNQVIPEQLRFVNREMRRTAPAPLPGGLRELVDRCYRHLGPTATAHLVDGIKRIGFEYATRGGMTIAVSDIEVPKEKKALLADADGQVTKIDGQYQRGLITEDERYEAVVDVWQKTSRTLSDKMMANLDPQSAVAMMTTSGARGNKGNIGQLGAMRGLMADPSGRIIDVPVRSNFREGMTVLEYFISTHGARKGLADTALRTADSGYLTRRLVDVAQDVITRDDDCGTEEGSWITRSEPDEPVGEEDVFARRLVGRFAVATIASADGTVFAERNEELNEEVASRIAGAGIQEVLVRSPLTCEARYGVCRMCYGRNLATGSLVGVGEAVGIIAAQSIGEPGTQLTMRTFHTGGVAQAGADITAGLPRVEELFEARIPKGKAEISHIDGIVEIIRADLSTKVKVTSVEGFDAPLRLPPGAELLAAAGDLVEKSQVLARVSGKEGGRDGLDIVAPEKGILIRDGDQLAVRAEDRVEREYSIPHNARLRVENGQEIRAGDAITDGPINPQEYLDTRGKDAVQRYLVKEVQKVYRSQGVTINDKHIEIIVRQMLRKVRIDQPGDTDLLPTELIDRLDFERVSNRVLAEGGEPATAQVVLLGVTKASLNTASFLAAASFQETTRVLTEAAINGSKDHLIGLKENVIIGKLIPAGTGAPANVATRREADRRRAAEALAGGELPVEFGGAAYNPFLEDAADGGGDDDTVRLSALLAATDDDDTSDAADDGFNPFLSDAGESVAATPGIDEDDPRL
jgi:DNA-directed RNA polymerase subunit beta'